MEYKLKGGHVVDDEALDRMAEEWETGAWEGHLENVVLDVKKPADQDEMVVESFRVQRSRLAAIDHAVRSRGISKSEFYRLAVDRELAALA